MSRKNDRRHLFNLVFQIPFLGGDAPSFALARYMEHGTRDETANVDINFVESSFLGVVSHLPEIDGKIEAAVQDWELNRIPSADLAILRLSAYECLFRADVAVQVSINEAVELAKIYGEGESPKFINGVLGRIAESL